MGTRVEELAERPGLRVLAGDDESTEVIEKDA